MAASAGLRKTRPVVRFADEFGSLGSNPTPHHLELVKLKTIYAEHKENLYLNQQALWRDAFEEALTLEGSIDLNSLRGNIYKAFFRNHPEYMVGEDHAALKELAYWMPYYYNQYPFHPII